ICFFRSLLRASDSAVVGGTSFSDFHLFTIGLSPTKDQIYLSNDPNSFWTSRNRFALLTAAATLSLFLTIPGLSRSFSIFAGVNLATLTGSNSAKAFL